MNRARIALLLVVLAAIAAFFVLDLGRFLSFELLRAALDDVRSFRDSQPVLSSLLYFVTYVGVTALSLPGAAVMTLAGGAIFGLGWGLLLVSFASSLGALLAFLVARFIARDAIQQRYGNRLLPINQGIERDGPFYLFALRLVPAFPFFLINLVMALTPLRAWTFYWVSQLGMLPGTAVYINAGTQIGQLDSPGGIFSPVLISSFVLLGLFPLVARKLLDWLRARRVYRGFRRPRRFDRNLIVIGAGAAGLVSSYIATAVKARVTLVERDRMGGDCLNSGCVPSKTLIGTSRLLDRIRRSADYGIAQASARFDLPFAMQRVHEVIRAIEPHDSVERYRSLGVDVRQGEARIIDPWTVEIADAAGERQRLTARSLIIATGAEPVIPPLPGLDGVDCLTSENLWELRDLPQRLLVLGGGPIGCELSQAFARLGARVTLVEMSGRLLAREDREFSTLVEQRFRAEGIDVRTGTRALRVESGEGRQRLLVSENGREAVIPFDRILAATGRRPRLEGFGLEELGILTDGRLELDDYLRTRIPNIYACGDVAGRYQFTHTASHMAWFCAVNALFGRFRKFRVDYSVVPWATFTEPEIARVGINEQEAIDQGIPHEVTTYGIDDLDRAIVDGEAYGLIKVLTPPAKDRILGVTIAGPHAGDMIAEFVLAMRHGLGLNKILGTIHIYPTLNEANKYAAGQWKQAHKPEGLLRWVERYHRWQRS
ncbi:MAG: FAD-dependent oxidoreductase [Chromatiales bacterium]|nr:FAD-dependent oxidoreductase [Chromatiales bacterium]